MYRKIIFRVGFSTICGFGHPLGTLEGIPHGWRLGAYCIHLSEEKGFKQTLTEASQQEWTWRSGSVSSPPAEGG